MKTLGFESQKKFFKDGLASHAYLFTGPERIGKKTFARELASGIAKPEDIFLVSTSDVDTARSIKNFLSLSPLRSEHKVAIVDNAESLTDEAQNALLKVLEEPSASSKLVLIAKDRDAVLSTIASRTQEIMFAPHPREVYGQFFADKKLSKAQQDFLYEFSNGSIGLLFDLDYKNIKSYAEEFTSLAKADLDGRFAAAQKLADDEQLAQKVLFWMLYLRTKKRYQPLRGLLTLYGTISQPQFNKQLALEQFMLELGSGLLFPASYFVR